jgi:hypothetical protein
VDVGQDGDAADGCGHDLTIADGRWPSGTVTSGTV